MASESGCPIEHHRIPVDKCDHMYDPECNGAKYMPFLRAAYDRNTGQSPNSPREQVMYTIFFYIPTNEYDVDTQGETIDSVRNLKHSALKLSTGDYKKKKKCTDSND